MELVESSRFAFVHEWSIGTEDAVRSWRVNPKPGDSVVLTGVPPGLLEGLPTEDQTAILEVVGKQVLLAGYEDDGRAELEFTDKHGTIHYSSGQRDGNNFKTAHY